MPITINGSGTVTGISAGGLPDGCIVTADIADNNVTTAKIDNISVTEIKIADANITPAKLAQPLTLETAKSATGTEVDFTSIPSWVKRITLMLDGLSTSGTSPVIVQLGDSGGPETSGYLSQAAGISTTAIDTTRSGTNTDGFRLAINAHAATNAITGKIDIVNISSNTWIAQGIILAFATFPTMTVGSKTTSATLDRVRITTVGGTDTFDDGTINIMYE
jgi:hypothetical protein